MWRTGWVYHKLQRRPAAALQPEHLPPLSADADLLRLDAPAVADDGAAARCRAPSRRRLQRDDDLQLRAVRAGDVRAGGTAHGLAGRGVRLGIAVRFLSVPLRALQPLRAADDLLHAARVVGPASVREHRLAAATASHSACSSAGAVLLLDVLRGLLHVVCRQRFSSCFACSRVRRFGGCSVHSRLPACWRGACAPAVSGLPAAHLGDRDVEAVRSYSATAADYLRAHHRSAMWGDRTLPGRQPERALFPGVMVAGARGDCPGSAARRDARRLRRRAGAHVRDLSRLQQARLSGLVRMAAVHAGATRTGARQRARGYHAGDSGRARGSPPSAAGGAAGQPRCWPPSPIAVAIASTPQAVAASSRSGPNRRRFTGWFGLTQVVLAEFPMRRPPALYLADIPYMYFSLWHWATTGQRLQWALARPISTISEGACRPFPEPTTLDLLRARGATHVSGELRAYTAAAAMTLSSARRPCPIPRHRLR